MIHLSNLINRAFSRNPFCARIKKVQAQLSTLQIGDMTHKITLPDPSTSAIEKIPSGVYEKFGITEETLEQYPPEYVGHLRCVFRFKTPIHSFF